MNYNGFTYIKGLMLGDETWCWFTKSSQRTWESIEDFSLYHFLVMTQGLGCVSKSQHVTQAF